MPFEIVRNNIENMQVDALVDFFNRNPLMESAAYKGKFESDGKEVHFERKNLGNVNLGESFITPRYSLDSKYVIHTAAPIWEDGTKFEENILSSCYKSALALAKDHDCESIAFPLISSGNYGFKNTLYLETAVREISYFLSSNDMQIYLVVPDKEAFSLSDKLFESVSSYIDENYIGRRDNRISKIVFNPDLESETVSDSGLGEWIESDSYNSKSKFTYTDDWGQLLKNLDAGFSETLLKLIDRSGKTDAEIYKKANVDRKLFSKIRNNMDYRPSKRTALAFAFALELDIDETRDFIGRAGFALSHSSKFDVIVEYFLINENYDIFELNEVLFAFDQPLIGE